MSRLLARLSQQSKRRMLGKMRCPRVGCFHSWSNSSVVFLFPHDLPHHDAFVIITKRERLCLLSKRDEKKQCLECSACRTFQALLSIPGDVYPFAQGSSMR